MQFQKSKLILLSLLSLNIYANDSILSDTNKNIFSLQKEKNSENTSKLIKEVINPITYKYSHDYSDTANTISSSIGISQPIFKSGGIYSAIKYANYLEEYSEININIKKKDLIKEATKILFSLNKIDLSIQQQKILIKNALIDVNRKKEQVLNGLLDTSYLDKSLIQKNKSKSTLIDLYFKKDELINTLTNISNKTYKELELPVLSLISKNEFINNNLLIKQNKANINKNTSYKNTIRSKYLPSVNVYYNYIKYHDTDNQDNRFKDGDKYGFNITVPFYFSTFNDIEKEKINIRLSKLELEKSITKENNLYKISLSKLKSLDAKIDLAKEDYELYDSLLKIIIEEKDAQIKTQSDVDTLKNSQTIRALDIIIFNFDKQIILLDLYSKIN